MSIIMVEDKVPKRKIQKSILSTANATCRHSYIISSSESSLSYRSMIFFRALSISSLVRVAEPPVPDVVALPQL